jgi:uncharacterized protein (TIGR02594 family)
MIEPAWLTVARRDIGQRETHGSNRSPWLDRLWRMLGKAWLIGQPWCGAAVARWMRSQGVRPPANFERALAWAEWGVPLDTPVVGCVVVFRRTGGGHVGLLAGEDERGRLLVLGGNQNNTASIAPFEGDRVVGYYWPTEYLDALHYRDLPVYASAAPSSTNEA